MPKQVIVSMEDEYPFGECEEISSQNVKVLVRKIYDVSAQQRNKLLEKVNVLRRLKNEHMIKVESVLEEDQSIHFLFQYIPIKVETWISNINDQFIENFRDQLIKFSSFLANNGIRINFELKNIGMDHNYNAKYFLDLNFDIIPLQGKEKLKSLYIRDITNLFKPYLTNSSINQPMNSDRDSDRKPKAKEPPQKVPDSSISPPTNKPGSQNKEKNIDRYKQEVNMSVDSENEQILQDIMGVLDNDEEETAHQSDLKYTQNSSPQYGSHKFFSQKQYPPPVNQNNSYSEKNIIGTNINNQPKKSQMQNKNIPTNAFSKAAKNNWIDPAEYMRESIELQNRVRSAIQKSVSAIKRFRQIRDHLQD